MNEMKTEIESFNITVKWKKEFVNSKRDHLNSASQRRKKKKEMKKTEENLWDFQVIIKRSHKHIFGASEGEGEKGAERLF